MNTDYFIWISIGFIIGTIIAQFIIIPIIDESMKSEWISCSPITINWSLNITYCASVNENGTCEIFKCNSTTGEMIK